jgi:hypothetical protein
MEWGLELARHEYPAAALMVVGSIVAVMGMRRAGRGIAKPIGESSKVVTFYRGFRQAVVGLAVVGVGAAWMWHAPWLLALSLVIGLGELLESTIDIWAVTKGKDFRITLRR